jgi:hypothetical protein
MRPFMVLRRGRPVRRLTCGGGGRRGWGGGGGGEGVERPHPPPQRYVDLCTRGLGA